MIRWEQGRAEVDDLLTNRRLERATANPEHARRILTQARRHVSSASALRESDLELAFSAAYDAARKALTALLAAQGLRPTSAGGHVAVYQSALAQFHSPMGRTIKPFDWMRRTRNDTEYPSADTPTIEAEDLDEAVLAATAILELSERLIEQLPPYGR